MASPKYGGKVFAPLRYLNRYTIIICRICQINACGKLSHNSHLKRVILVS